MSVIVTQKFLQRTLRIRFGNSIGVGIYANLGGSIKILTALHVVAGIEPGNSIAIRHMGDWAMIEIDAIRPAANGADVCALRPKTQWGEALPAEDMDDIIVYGQEVSYCGFPLGMELQGPPQDDAYPLPFVKRAVFSGQITNDGVTEYYFDTLNNSGFSGGPVIKLDHADKKLKIVAIVSGFRFDKPFPIYQRNEEGELVAVPDFVVQPNSGFMRAIPIRVAREAAEAIG